MRSIFRNPRRPSVRGDGEAKRARADRIARLTGVADSWPEETAAGEPGKYASPPGRATAATEHAPEKIRRARPRTPGPVPETDTGGRVEDTKALERFTVKELGKLTP